MIAHEDRFGKGSKRVQAWRSALLEAANMPGEHIQTSDESKFIEKIAEKGSDKIQGIILDPPKHEAVDWNGSTFEKMKWLRILVVQNTSFSSKPQHLPNYLRLLDWEEYPSNSLPLKFHPKNIIVFNLCRSHMMQKEVEKLFKDLNASQI
ncbi:hypothetical protein RJT34_11020 [Clitoria ternatea]|uniref:TIR domain-containing protein n=1 Tax=Clitoria ternatea TaxID=43366 RepID=A0AAN9PJ71_CLITE